MEKVQVEFTSFVTSLGAGAAASLQDAEAVRSGKTSGSDEASGEEKALTAEEAAQRVQVDLATARQLIDTLAMLEKKTSGNLSPEEQQVLQASLTNLRIAYVKLATPAN